ncbi:hypothetical protein GCM10010994_29310 [Chelatococcus reniformis]|uniref:TNase-like domain-containing protein n=1 Tax=Chelatococcus reniformis TaxID=1494448 RepID=A0A916UCP8_9HYPH|nr:hypothetical protein GCM10010994_29310 [Chelatococcus reniformis]
MWRKPPPPLNWLNFFGPWRANVARYVARKGLAACTAELALEQSLALLLFAAPALAADDGLVVGQASRRRHNRAGQALASVRDSHEYAPEEAEARAAKAGMWAADFLPPWEWRALAPGH